VMNLKMQLIQFASIMNWIQMKSREVSDDPWRNSIWELLGEESLGSIRIRVSIRRW
jgi:hypothetical protein